MANTSTHQTVQLVPPFSLPSLFLSLKALGTVNAFTLLPFIRASQAIHAESTLGLDLAHCDQLPVAGSSAGKVL